MWLDDAVETFKCHIEYEEGATQTRHPGYCNNNYTVQELIFCVAYLVYVIQIPKETWK